MNSIYIAVKYEKLKEFIHEKMRLYDGYNYQPVVIRTLNQSHGKATKDVVIDELQKYNPSFPKSHFTSCPAFEVLENHGVIKFNSNTNEFELLDYDDIDTFYGRKAEITKLCDDKIENRKNSTLIDEQKFQIAHKLFEQEMLEKSNGVVFENFEHPILMHGEIDYKREILEKTKHLRLLENWQNWKQKGRILDQLREACSQQVFKNLLMGNNYGVETSSAASLFLIPEAQIHNFEDILYYFFQSAILNQDDFSKNFDKLINFIKSQNLKVDWRFISYLAFIANPEQFIHVHPTRFEKLFQFYGNSIKLRANFSWQVYSQVLEICNELKSKLAKYGNIDNAQLHSYIWVTSPLIEKLESINYWLIRAGKDGEFWEDQKNNNFVGIHYYTLGNLKELFEEENGDDDKIKEKIKEEIKNKGKEELSNAQLGSIIGQFKLFLQIKPGDKVVAISDNFTLLGVGEVKGDYQFRSEFKSCHTFPTNWEDTTVRKISIPPFSKTIKQISPIEFEIMMSRASIAKSDLELEEYAKVLRKKKQLIFYGPPGTGKTYTAKALRDFIIENNSSNPTLTFKDAAIKILNDEGKPLHYEDITKRALDQNLIQTKGETPEFTMLKEMSKEIQILGDTATFVRVDKGTYGLNPKRAIGIEPDIHWYKNTQTNHKFHRDVTFHQSYSYEEFIEGLRPQSINKQVVYNIEPGIFKILCEDAKADPKNDYVLFIDEINRGNISKIFGELITLIEKDKRGDTLQLAYSKEDFSVPENLYIIGTMNTADRSLVQIDAALRRRFAFCELLPKSELLKQKIEGIDLRELLEKINERIVKAGLREKQIGHSYLLDVQDLEGLQFVFANEIIPLLQDYFFDDYKKLEEDILSSDFVDSEKMIIKEDWKRDSLKFLELLKNTFEL